mmetsp:Transcript_52819/g.87730  ORF Transcript_52819/g.87730 Transcript_52819/m.87730 type:complete len:81 (-) Transcript_52819:595-837(-)
MIRPFVEDNSNDHYTCETSTHTSIASYHIQVSTLILKRRPSRLSKIGKFYGNFVLRCHSNNSIMAHWAEARLEACGAYKP